MATHIGHREIFRLHTRDDFAIMPPSRRSLRHYWARRQVLVRFISPYRARGSTIIRHYSAFTSLPLSHRLDDELKGAVDAIAIDAGTPFLVIRSSIYRRLEMTGTHKRWKAHYFRHSPPPYALTIITSPLRRADAEISRCR